MRYFISLGSNLGSRRKNLIRAVSLLKKNRVKIIKASSLYETFPVGFLAQPWFINQVLEIETDMKPETFLSLVKNIEKRLGRKHPIQNGPRCIDIDILLAGNRVVQTEKLHIPHPELVNRNFVLVPLREISPDTVHPVIQKNIEELCQLCHDTSAVLLSDEEK